MVERQNPEPENYFTVSQKINFNMPKWFARYAFFGAVLDTVKNGKLEFGGLLLTTLGALSYGAMVKINQDIGKDGFEYQKKNQT